MTGPHAVTVEHEDRLDTPASSGFRMGMSSCAMIGRKLGSVYDAPPDMPRQFDTLLQALACKVDRKS